MITNLRMELFQALERARPSLTPDNGHALAGRYVEGEVAQDRLARQILEADIVKRDVGSRGLDLQWRSF